MSPAALLYRPSASAAGRIPAAQVEGLYSCLDYYQNVSDPFSKELLSQYDKLYPGSAKFTAGSACLGLISFEHMGNTR